MNYMFSPDDHMPVIHFISIITLYTVNLNYVQFMYNHIDSIMKKTPTNKQNKQNKNNKKKTKKAYQNTTPYQKNLTKKIPKTYTHKAKLFWLSRLGPQMFLLPDPWVIWLSNPCLTMRVGYLVKINPDARRQHWTIYLRFILLIYCQ